jgi:bacillithiol biosynthesis cysteine-adding enzyme BshC
MQCTCVRQTDLPNTSRLFGDLVSHFDRVSDLYPWAPNNIEEIVRASQFEFPDERRQQVVAALAPMNPGSASLAELAKPGTVAVITGQQVGLFSGPAYTVYKALTAVRIAAELRERGIPAVPMFWLATEDHDFAEIAQAVVFGPDHAPVKLHVSGPDSDAPVPAGEIALRDAPLSELRAALGDLPFADEAIGLVERAYGAGPQTMGSAFAALVRDLLAPYGLILIDPMTPELRRIAAPLMREAVLRMNELAETVMARSKVLLDRGYHAQVMVEKTTSFAFLLDNGQRIALRRGEDGFHAGHRKWTVAELADRAHELSPNALLRPVLQDYLFPTAAYVGGPAELAYLAQSRPLYDALLGRQPVAFPRAGFTLMDERGAKRVGKYRLEPHAMMVRADALRETIASRLVPAGLTHRIELTKSAFTTALDGLKSELDAFDPTLAASVETSRRKIEYQVGKMARKTATQILAKNDQAQRDAAYLSGLVFPDGHLQERYYSIVPFLAKFGPGVVDEIYQHVRVECPDHQFAVL